MSEWPINTATGEGRYTIYKFGKPWSLPATRGLANVLRQQQAKPSTEVRLVVATAETTPATEHASINVSIEGVSVQVPKVKGLVVPPGEPVYIMATCDFALAVGTVSTRA